MLLVFFLKVSLVLALMNVVYHVHDTMLHVATIQKEFINS
jgi:hypothetical protein